MGSNPILSAIIYVLKIYGIKIFMENLSKYCMALENSNLDTIKNLKYITVCLKNIQTISNGQLYIMILIKMAKKC